MNRIMWTLSLAATAGAVLNIAKQPACFIVWSITNAGWLAVKLHRREWHEALLWSANLMASLVGLFVW